MSETQEAAEARPWRSADGPAPRMHSYPPGARPLMTIRIEGAWRVCPVRSRADWPDGRVAYHVDVKLQRNGVTGTYPRAYWWGPHVMRPLA